MRHKLNDLLSLFLSRYKVIKRIVIKIFQWNKRMQYIRKPKLRDRAGARKPWPMFYFCIAFEIRIKKKKFFKGVAKEEEGSEG